MCVEDPDPPTPTTTPDGRPLTGLVLGVPEAQRAEPGSWTADGAADEGPVLDPCAGGTAYPADAQKTDDASTFLVATREAGGTDLVQQVARYRSAGAARGAWDGYRRAVEGCPTKPPSGPEGSTTTHEVVGTEEAAGVRTLFVREATTCDACSGAYAYYAVQQRADVVSVLSVAHGEDGDPGVDVVQPFAAEAAALLSPERATARRLPRGGGAGP